MAGACITGSRCGVFAPEGRRAVATGAAKRNSWIGSALLQFAPKERRNLQVDATPRTVARFHLPFGAILLTAAFCTLLAPANAFGYIGPGAGFALASSLFVIFWTFLLAILTILIWPFRWIVRAIRGRKAFARSRIRRLVILGLDGLEHTLATRYMAEGKMPNLKRLAEMGSFKLLGTTTPPLSPVAWSSFLTGVNPGKHNIFDFLNTDRRNYTPYLSSVDIRPPTKTLKLGKYVIPLNKPSIRLMRKGKPFWNTLGEHGIFTSVIRVPITWPPEKCRGVVLSAMCVPDLRGTQGLFAFYSTRSNDAGERTGGEQVQVRREGNVIRSVIIGPENSMKPGAGAMTVPFTVEIKKPGQAVLKINDEKFALREYVYTPWVTVKFKAAPGVTVNGICRFMLVSTDPDFELYAMPINLDPEKPAMPISHPQAYSTYLAKRYGPFATLGLAEDTWVLNEGLVEDRAFLDQCISIDAEREQQFFDALDNTKRGLCACVFDGTDRIQHMFWRYLERDHPAHPANLDKNYKPNGTENAIEDLYVRMDKIVGETMNRVLRDRHSMLMVISDHGFNSFRRGIDLNAWLIENGYMALKPGTKLGFKYLAEVDWSKSRAFALGLAGIFLNIQGRDAKGIVEPGDAAQKLKDEIAGKLTALNDPKTAQPAIRRVYDKEKCYSGPFREAAPDLVVGYHRGYRVDWDTAIGKVTNAVFHDNTKAWSGDHCIDPELIPGVLFCSHKVESESPRLMDLGPTALELFGVEVPKNMDGRPLKIDVSSNGAPHASKVAAA
ncbi:MAG TPA: alkaline phosphatase family protein [Phycisphaerae bacterium]|nr:alkaline phosphatase family protein [Phycisphaerae bacterium]